jgi:hypothetical protein
VQYYLGIAENNKKMWREGLLQISPQVFLSSIEHHYLSALKTMLVRDIRKRNASGISLDALCF